VSAGGKPRSRSDVTRIHRTTHTGHFTIVPNSILRDQNLSYGAAGCLGRILSNVDVWHVTAEGMWQQAKREGKRGKGEGRDVHYRWFTEMEVAGYLTRHRVAVETERGNPTYRTETHFWDVPVPPEQRTASKPKDGPPEEIRTPGFQEPEVQEPEHQEPEDQESIRRTIPKKDQEKENQSAESSSALRAAGDDDGSPDLGDCVPQTPAAGTDDGYLALAHRLPPVLGEGTSPAILAPRLRAVARDLGVDKNILVEAIIWWNESGYVADNNLDEYVFNGPSAKSVDDKGRYLYRILPDLVSGYLEARKLRAEELGRDTDSFEYGTYLLDLQDDREEPFASDLAEKAG
jgi:hypothetical protein